MLFSPLSFQAEGKIPDVAFIKWEAHFCEIKHEVFLFILLLFAFCFIQNNVDQVNICVNLDLTVWPENWC